MGNISCLPRYNVGPEIESVFDHNLTFQNDLKSPCADKVSDSVDIIQNVLKHQNEEFVLDQTGVHVYQNLHDLVNTQKYDTVLGTQDAYSYECKRPEKHIYLERERRFLEDMVKANKVDVRGPEISDMVACVKERFWKVVEYLRGTVLEVSDIALCGSMAEGTRLWEYEDEDKLDPNSRKLIVLEFDLLAILNAYANGNEGQSGKRYRVVSAKCKGHKYIVHCNDSDCFPCIYDGEFVIPSKLRTAIRKEVLRQVTGNHGNSRLTYMSDECSTEDSIRYTFLWKPCDLGSHATGDLPTERVRHDVCVINVDFMPAFLHQDTCNGTGHYLVPKSQCGHRTCCLQSYCLQEIQSLLDTSQVHRDVYMLLKSFYKHLPYKSPSYYLKTAVLHHIRDCTKPDILVCFRCSLQVLSRAFSKGELLTLDGHINLLSKVHPFPNLISIPDLCLHFLDNVTLVEASTDDTVISKRMSELDEAMLHLVREREKRIFDSIRRSSRRSKRHRGAYDYVDFVAS